MRFSDLQAHEDRWPLPSPRLLALHDDIGSIWHASGMADYVERILREADSIQCLSKNGSTDIQFLQILPFICNSTGVIGFVHTIASVPRDLLVP